MTKANNTGKRVFLSYVQRKALDEYLQTVCERVMIDGIHVGSRYLDGHDDNTVVEAMPFPVTYVVVGELRRTLFGKFYTETKAPSGVTKSVQIANLESRVTALEATVKALESLVGAR